MEELEYQISFSGTVQVGTSPQSTSGVKKSIANTPIKQMMTHKNRNGFFHETNCDCDCV
jgi:hypothetical protein